MGLDSYVKVKVKQTGSTEEMHFDLWYGRKENEIHGWMQRHSNVASEDFNCEEFPLTKELMDMLEEAIKSTLPQTSGFFFGVGNKPEEVIKAAEELIQVTRESLAQGKEPYYYSWW
jgi:hypothetical protein